MVAQVGDGTPAYWLATEGPCITSAYPLQEVPRSYRDDNRARIGQVSRPIVSIAIISLMTKMEEGMVELMVLRDVEKE